MNLLIENLEWMGANLALAAAPVVFGWIMLKANNKLVQSLSLLILMLFLPNTIYLVTDLIHVPKQWNQLPFWWEKTILLFQYSSLQIIGFLTFTFSISYIHKFINNLKNNFLKQNNELVIMWINYLVGFGIVLGRIQRTNSWHVFTDTERVIRDAVNVLSSFEQILLALIFGSFSNFIYFTFKDRFSLIRKWLPEIGN